MGKETIAYVPAERWKGVEGADEFLLDLVTGKMEREIDLYREYGAVYNLETDTTYPADPQIRAEFLAGKIPDVLKVTGPGGSGFKGHQPKYKVGYSWGKYKIVGYATGETKRYTGANYIIRCNCGKERVVRSTAVGVNQSCMDCKNL